MKLLFDQNISFRLAHKLSPLFPDSKHVKELGLENSTDKIIWNYAKVNKFTIVTFDGDFFDFSLVWGFPPKIIWLRILNQISSNIESKLISHQSLIIDFLEQTEFACLEIISND